MHGKTKHRVWEPCDFCEKVEKEYKETMANLNANIILLELGKVI